VASLPANGATCLIHGGDARSAKDVFDGSLATTISAPRLILTSPPYGAAQKYIRSSELAIGWAGLGRVRDLAALEYACIGREHLREDELTDLAVPSPAIASDIERIGRRDPRRAAIYADYFRGMDCALQSLSRVLSPNGALIIVAGTNVVTGQVVNTHKHLIELGLRHGLMHILELRDEIRGRVLLTKRANSGVPLQSEAIHVLQKVA
jgi:hypothetical protein